MSSYRTDQEQLEFIGKRIERLEKVLERLETLGMSNISSAGQSKSFRNQEEIRLELERATYEYKLLKSRLDGEPVNPTFKETILCSRKQYSTITENL